VPGELAAALGVDAAPLVIEPLALWPSEGQCFVGAKRLAPSRRQLEVLRALASRAGHIVPRERVHELAWGEPMPGGRRDVDVYVHRLRFKLHAVAPDWTFIHTHPQFGDRFWPERREAE
jgi:DNA-binding response OmpR family regulator